MLELLWKPFKVIKSKENPVVFDELCSKYGNDKSFRPLVIFYDEKTDNYYFLKVRAAFISDNSVNPPKVYQKEQLKGEVLVPCSTEKNGLFSKDSYVDCSQIFIMKKNELESLVDFNSDEFKKTKKLSDKYICEILNSIKNCLYEKPPYFSILKIFINSSGITESKSLYLCDQKISEILSRKKDIKNKTNLSEFFSNNNSNSLSQNRFQNGINFCSKFLDKYFPNEKEKFLNSFKDSNKDNENKKNQEHERER